MVDNSSASPRHLLEKVDQNFTKGVQLPIARQLCCFPNKNTAVSIDASIMGTAAFFFARPQVGAVGLGISVARRRNRCPRLSVTNGYHRRYCVDCTNGAHGREGASPFLTTLAFLLYVVGGNSMSLTDATIASKKQPMVVYLIQFSIYSKFYNQKDIYVDKRKIPCYN